MISATLPRIMSLTHSGASPMPAMALVGLSVVLASVMSIQRALARQAAGAKTKKAP